MTATRHFPDALGCFAFLFIVLIAASACGGLPDLDGVLVYASDSGIAARNLKTGETWTVLGEKGASEIAADRQGTQIVFAVMQGERQVLLRHRVAVKSTERLCSAPNDDPPWRVSHPAFSPMGDWISFVSEDVLERRKLEMAVGSGLCLPVADSTPAAAWAPGTDRLLVTDGKSVAVHVVGNPLEPWKRPKKGWPPMLKTEGDPIKALAVNRNFDRYAVLQGTALRVYDFASPEPRMTSDLRQVLSSKKGFVLPERLVFSPDGRYLAVSCGPDQDPSLFLVSAQKKYVSGRKRAVRFDLEPRPKSGQVAWVPRFLRN